MSYRLTVTETCTQSIVKRLIAHLDTADGTYGYRYCSFNSVINLLVTLCFFFNRDQVLERILNICSQESFAFIEDFEW